MKIDLKEVEDACKELYIRALKLLPPDIKEGFKRLDATETDATGKSILGTMIRNISGRRGEPEPAVPGHRHPDLQRDDRQRRRGRRLSRSSRRSSKAASARRQEHPLRSSVVHPVTRKNQHTSSGRLVPVINIDFVPERRDAVDRDDPQGLGLGEQLVAQDGGPGGRHRRGQDVRHRLRARRGRQDVSADDRRRRRRRHRGPVRAPLEGRRDAPARQPLRRPGRREARSASSRKR